MCGVASIEWTSSLGFSCKLLFCGCLFLVTMLLVCLFILIIYFVMQLEALIHPFFDELRDPNARLPNGRILPPLFNFKPHGMICSQYSFINSFEVPVYDCYWFLSTLRVRAERSASWDACQADPRACKKAVCLPWVVMLSFLAVCSLQKMVLHCREVASGLFNVESYASCVICYASPVHLFHFHNYFEVYVHLLSLCREQVKKALRSMLLRPPGITDP